METDQESNIPKWPLQIGDSNEYIRGITILSPKILVEITIRDIHSGEEWKSGSVFVPPPLQSFGEAVNKFRASIVHPSEPIPPTRTLDPKELQPYCLRYRYAHDHVNLDEQNLKLVRLQLFKEWEAEQKAKQIYPYGSNDRGSSVQKARKAARRNFNDALEGYLKEWIKNQNIEPYSD